MDKIVNSAKLTRYCRLEVGPTFYYGLLLVASRDVSSDLADVALSTSTCTRVCALSVDTGLVCSAVLVP